MRMRDTNQLRTLLRIFLDDPRRPRYGYELAVITRVNRNSVYVTLRNLEALGCLASYQERLKAPGRIGPRRRMYLLTNFGVREARNLLHHPN